MDTSELLAGLSEIVGHNNVLDDDRDLAGNLTDARGRYRGRVRAMVRPADVAQVAQVMRLCCAQGIPVVPQGGNTGMCGGATPDDSGRSILLNLSRMNRIRAVDLLNNTVAVDAGCTLMQVQQAADEAGRMFPLSLGSEGSCQIGGNIATNAGGTAVLRHGPMRDLVMGLEVVLPDGRIWNGMKGLRKDNTGYALKHLFIGSEGTLGVVTGAVLKLVPRPAVTAVALAGLPGIEEAVSLLHEVRARAGERVSAFEVMSASEYDLVMALPQGLKNPLPGPHPWYVLVELADPDARSPLGELLTEILAEAAGRNLVSDAVLAAGEAQASHIWHIRHSVTEANVGAGLTFSHDTAVPVSRVAEFVRRIEAEAARRLPDALPVFVGHIGDGNIHAVLVFPRANYPDAESQTRCKEAANALVDEVTLALGGSISAEHGIGRSNRSRLQAYLTGDEMGLMRGIKALFDPQNLMNPGVLIEGQP